MACNYSNKFLPLVISIAESVEWNKDLLNAELTKLFENPDVAMQDAEGLITFTSEQEAKKAVGDTMYGYYDSTKKSLMQSTLLGGLMM